MSDREKAAKLLAKLVSIHRPMVWVEVEDILKKCDSKTLDMYYKGCCKNV